VAATPPAVPAAPGADLPAVDDRELSRVWEGDVLPRVAEERPPLAAALHRARPVALEGGVLRLAFPSNDAFHKSVADQERNRDALGSVLTGVFGQRLRVRMETIDVQPEPGNGGDAATEPAAPDAVAEPDDPLEREEAFIARLRSEFDATDFDAPEEGS
jgi:hypothetical protein